MEESPVRATARASPPAGFLGYDVPPTELCPNSTGSHPAVLLSNILK